MGELRVPKDERFATDEVGLGQRPIIWFRLREGIQPNSRTENRPANFVHFRPDFSCLHGFDMLSALHRYYRY
jgi:hypothetical protein